MSNKPSSSKKKPSPPSRLKRTLLTILFVPILLVVAIFFMFFAPSIFRLDRYISVAMTNTSGIPVDNIKLFTSGNEKVFSLAPGETKKFRMENKGDSSGLKIRTTAKGKTVTLELAPNLQGNMTSVRAEFAAGGLAWSRSEATMVFLFSKITGNICVRDDCAYYQETPVMMRFAGRLVTMKENAAKEVEKVKNKSATKKTQK